MTWRGCISAGSSRMLRTALLGDSAGLLVAEDRQSAERRDVRGQPVDVRRDHAVFLDRKLAVVGISDERRPLAGDLRRGAKAVLELPAGESRAAGSRGDHSRSPPSPALRRTAF